MPHTWTFRDPALKARADRALMAMKAAAARSLPFPVLYSPNAHEKQAIGGEGQDIPFEQAFSDLAHMTLQDRAPQLFDYEVGFQLVDRNEENTKAIGVFGFRVGSQWLYAPVFFLNGALKGHELLYVVNQDLFVPLKENWINELVNRKPMILGSPVSRNSQSLGVRPPDLTALSTSPQTMKAANVLARYAEWARPAIVKMAHIATTANDPKYSAQPTLRDFLMDTGEPYISLVTKMAMAYPTIAKAIDKWYGINMLKEALDNWKEKRAEDTSVLNAERKTYRTRRTGSVLDPTHPVKLGHLQVYTYAEELEDRNPSPLTDSEREKLLQDTVLIRDGRGEDDVSVRMRIEEPQAYTNPTESGLYDVLSRPGNHVKCFIAMGPVTGHGKKPLALVYPLDNMAEFTTAHPGGILVSKQYSTDDFKKWFDGLSSASLKPGPNKYIAVGPDMDATAPFRVESELAGKDKDEDSYNIRTDSLYSSGPDHTHYMDRSDLDEYSRYKDGERIHLTTKKGSALRAGLRGDIYVPEGFKVIMVHEASAEEQKNYDKYEGSYAGNESRDFMLGDQLSLQMNLLGKSAEMKLQNDGNEVIFFPSQLRFTNTKSALVHLVRDRGFRESVAEEMLKEAYETPLHCKTFQVKYALPYLFDSAPSAPGIPEVERGGVDRMMGSSSPAQIPQEDLIPVEGMSDQQAARDAYDPQLPPPEMLQQVSDAAATGQRELFDTSMFMSMLRATRDDMQIDRYIPKLMAGNDATARILFDLYWHQEEFAERYGQTELPEMEDALRNQFEGGGDLILKLKRKTTEAYPERPGEIDLEAIANG